MKACIAVFSQTGHSATFARAIAEQLRKSNCETDIELLRPTKFAKPSSTNIELRRIPDTSDYDAVLVGGPMWAFRINPVLPAFLNAIKTLKQKRAGAFITHALPYCSFGLGKRALADLNATLELLGADTIEGASLHWLFSPNKQTIDEAAAGIAGRLIEG